MDRTGEDRRAVLKGCLVLCSAGVLGGCASYGSPAAAPPAAPPAEPAPTTAARPAETTAEATSEATSEATAEDGAGGATGSAGSAGEVKGALARVDDIPVGGALILADAGLVLVRPDRGTVKALTATCPHAGCSVGSVEGDVVVCPCHGSRFALADGSVVRGPAGRALDAVAVRVKAGHVLRS